MRYILLFVLSLRLFCGSAQPTNAYSEIIKEQAEKMGQALIKDKFDSLAMFTYPKIIEMAGGRDQLIENFKKQSDQTKQNGISWLTIAYGEPTAIILAFSELQCTLPQTMEMKVSGGRLVSKSTLVAISTDNGKNWFFVDANGANVQTLKKTLPNLSGDLVLPPMEDPVLYDK